VRLGSLVLGFILFMRLMETPASAEPPSGATAAPAPFAVAEHGMAVIALEGATDAAWPLAQELYSHGALEGSLLDEAHARVLCGEPPAAGAPTELHDLAATVTAVRGDDAPSRALLGSLARHFALHVFVVVRMNGGRPLARVFLPDVGAFDAAIYVPDGESGKSWSGATRSLSRTFGIESAATPAPAPTLATHPLSGGNLHEKSRPFFLSPWFWGALGIAAGAGGVAYLVTRDMSSHVIHLQVQVPHS
jgi:hypothetical protein